MSSVSASSQQGDTPVSGVSWVEAVLRDAEGRQQAATLSPQVCSRIAQARQVWGSLLFPTPKLEAWKYTNPEAIAQGPFALPTKQDMVAAQELLVKAAIPNLAESVRVVYVDGVYTPELSNSQAEKGLVLSRLSEGSKGELVGSMELHKEEAFAALATALLSDAVCISVERGKTLSAPIHVIHLVTNAAEGCVVSPRLVIDAQESSKITVVESHHGQEGVRYLSLPIAEIKAQQNAKVDYYKLQLESKAAYHVSGVIAESQRDAEVRGHIFSFGGALVRNNGQMLLRGANSQSLLNGLSLLSGTQHVDNTTLIHHIEPSAESREHFKGIYAGESRGVFSGTITVEKIAQKTNAFQSNQALLLSSDASIESRPQLKIWADDVKCTHGATVGQLDADALFYLRSRGIGEDAAKAFLVHAFASEVLSSVAVAPVKEYVEGIISSRLDTLAC
jgi:Fe-S cluster assembly protein SufD